MKAAAAQPPFELLCVLSSDRRKILIAFSSASQSPSIDAMVQIDNGRYYLLATAVAVLGSSRQRRPK